MIQLLVILFIGYLLWMCLGPIIVFLVMIGLFLIGVALCGLALYSLAVAFKFIRDGITLRKGSSLLDKSTTEEYLANLTSEQKRKLAKIIESYLTNRTLFKDNLKEVALWSALGWTAADLGPSKALRYSLGYYGLRKIVRDKFTKK